MMPVHDSAVERILSGGAIGVATASGRAFYVHFEMLGSVPDDLCVEVTFNPEWVTIDKDPTDLIVQCASRRELRAWLKSLVRELSIELCPLPVEVDLRRLLFGPLSRDQGVIDADRPWQVGGET